MKKSVLILGLIISTVAFGKPAYKQWTEKEVINKFTTKRIFESGYFSRGYYYIYDKKGKKGDMVTTLFVNTNDARNDKFTLMVTVSTSEPIDFDVGDNEVFLCSVRYQTNVVAHHGKRAGAVFGMLVGANTDLLDATQTNVTTNVLALPNSGVKLVYNGEKSGRHTYSALLPDTDSNGMKQLDVLVTATFKYRGALVFSLKDYYHDFMYLNQRNEEDRIKSEREAILLARQKRAEDWTNAHVNTAKSLMKNFKTQYEGSMYRHSIWSKQGNYSTIYTGEHVRMTVTLDNDYATDYLQIQLFTASGNWGLMDNGAIYTADGSYTLTDTLTSYGVVGKWGDLSLTHSQHTMNIDTLKMMTLEKMLNSGQPIKVQFSGNNAKTVTYTLNKSERVVLRELVNFCKAVDKNRPKVNYNGKILSFYWDEADFSDEILNWRD